MVWSLGGRDTVDTAFILFVCSSVPENVSIQSEPKESRDIIPSGTFFFFSETKISH